MTREERPVKERAVPCYGQSFACITGLLLFLLLPFQAARVEAADPGENTRQNLRQNLRPDALPELLLNDELVKKDERVRKLVEEKGDNAIIFLQEMLQEDPEGERKYEKFLEKVLDPEHLPHNVAQIELAQQLVKTMGVLIAEDEWQNLASRVDLLIELVAKGPESFRKTLRETLLIFIRQEKARGQRRDTIDKLGKKLVKNHAPSAEEIREISKILWHADGKSLVSFLIAGLELNQDNALVDPTMVSGYIIELRRRLLLDFATVEDWKVWWQRNAGDSIETILAASQRAYVKRRVALWRKNLRRFREVADPLSYFRALEESFASDSLEEARIVALDELAEFPAWLKELRLDPATFDDAARQKLLESGVELLLEMLEGLGAYTHESISVRTSTMAALGAFAAVIGDRDDEATSESGVFRKKVVEALLRDLETHKPLELSSLDEDRHEYRVEFIRTVGLLGVSEVHGALRDLLENSTSADSREDFAVVAEAVTSLGKILRGNRITAVDRDVAQILAVYKLACERGERAKKSRQNTWGELRKTCINAVHIPIADAETLLEVRGVYRKILSPDVKDVPERIPAIIGLGILAEHDEASRQMLVGVLRQRDEYEPSDVSTAVNAISYLDDKKASLSCFIEFLGARDRPFSSQVWKRAVNTLKRGSPELRVWLVDELEKFGFESVSTDYARVVVGLGKEPGFEGLFSSEKSNSDDIELLWRSAVAEIAALGLLGEEDEAIDRVRQLKEFWDVNQNVLELAPGTLRNLEKLRQDLLAKKAFREALVKTPALSAAELENDLLAIVSPEGDARARWQRLAWAQRQLQQLRPSESTRDLVGAFVAKLTDDASYWSGIADEPRQRYFKSLTEIHAKLQDATARSE